MFLTDQGLESIGEQADKMKNVNLMFLVQILKEIREIKTLLETHEDSGNCGNNGSQCTDDSENENG